MMKLTNAALFCVMSLCAAVLSVGQAHPAVVVGGASYGCNCPTLNVLAARHCCTTVGTCCLMAGMGAAHFGGHLGGVGIGAGLPVVPYGTLGIGVRRPILAHTPLAHGGLQLNIGAGLGR